MYHDKIIDYVLHTIIYYFILEDELHAPHVLATKILYHSTLQKYFYWYFPITNIFLTVETGMGLVYLGKPCDSASVTDVSKFEYLVVFAEAVAVEIINKLCNSLPVIQHFLWCHFVSEVKSSPSTWITVYLQIDIKHGLYKYMLDKVLVHLSWMLKCTIVITRCPSSVRQLVTFSTSPLKPLNQIQRNLTGIKISMFSTKFVFFGPMGKNKMAVPASDWPRPFRLLLWNCWTEFNKTWKEPRSQCPLLSWCFSGR